MTNIQQLVNAVLSGDRRATAKAITIIENDSSRAQKLVSLLYPHTGNAHIIGITGPSGVGKSTLVEKLAKKLRQKGKTVGVVAVDPTSPFSGGAFLGDRIRMQDLSTDQGVFIRSMATRNNPGGLARTTKEAVHILDAAGMDIIIVETVGAGQSEVDIIQIAQTIVVVLAPGLGDEIQAIKAGLMEIGDIFVINKADREDSNKAATDVQTMLGIGSKNFQWKPAIIKTIAMTGEGTAELLGKIEEHKGHLKGELDDLRQRKIVETELTEAIKRKIAEYLINELRKSGQLDELISEVLARKIDPLTAAEKIVTKQLKKN